MTNDTPDLLQIKIDEARSKLPEEVREAVDAVPWKTVILAMRMEKGYSFSQLESLEIETELLLCGLLDTDDYPKEIEKRMHIPEPQAKELVNEMNDKVFHKIREKLVQIIEEKKAADRREEISVKIAETPPVPGIAAQKLYGVFKMPTVTTDHSLANTAKNMGGKVSIGAADPYREPPQ